MILHHIALTVNSTWEIKNFYEDILLFSTKNNVKINSEIINMIFSVNQSAEVCFLCLGDSVFEVFINPEKEKKIFSHVCLAYKDSDKIYEAAVKKGYKTLVKKNPGKNTYFIWDKSENLFEIKEI